VGEVECSGKTVYSCMKMEKMRHVETYPGMGAEEDKGE
jgi:hypothetical protein